MITTRRDSSQGPGDDLLDALAGLAVAPPVDLVTRVFAQWCRVPSPVGDVYVAFTERGPSYLRTSESLGHDEARFLEAFRERFGRPLLPARRPPAGLLRTLRSGSRPQRVDLRGLTTFEQDVLAATGRIPAGQTRPYAWVAKEVGRPRAVRAVGSALGRNPVPLLVPCHRVTRSDGRAGEYVFGREVKERLLRHEGVDIAELRGLASRRVLFVGSDTTNIVCFPTCAHARRITPRHRRGFGSLREAESAGYRPCLVCRPGTMTG
jgi:O-6-methylguanine DNA methyltransferase